MALSAAALAELAKVAPEIYPVLELALPTTTLRYASEGAPLASPTWGTYQGRVTEWGDIQRRASDARFALEACTISVTIADLDRSFAAYLEGASSRSVYGSAATIRLSSPNIPEAEWPVLFGGRIASIQGGGAFLWSLELRTGDDAFRAAEVPHLKISQYDFPNTPKTDVYGLPVPIVYGSHNSNDGTAEGAIGGLPAYYVNAVAGAYYALCGLGDLFHVEAVYLNGAVLAASAWERVTLVMPGFQATKAWRVGRRMTFIKFVSDPGADADVRWDGVGLAKNAMLSDSWASPLPVPWTNPAEQMRHFLNNFGLPLRPGVDTPSASILGPWIDGAWYDWSGLAWTDNALLDSASWTALAAWFEARGYRGAKWIGGQFSDALSLLNSWAETWGLALYWTAAGKLGVRAFDPAQSRVYYTADSQWLRAYEADVNPLIPTQDAEEIVGELAGNCWKPEGQNPRTVVTVADLALPRANRLYQRAWAAAHPQLPLETLDGPTAAYCADRLSAGTFVYQAYGDGLATWSDLKRTGSKYDLTQATSANQPVITAAVKAARPALLFDGSNDRMDGTAIANVLTVSAFTATVAFCATANGGASADASMWLNPAIWCDTNGNVGLHVQLSGGQNYLCAYVYAGGAAVVAKVAISLNTWYVATMRLSGGNLSIGISNFTSTSIACGNATLAGNLRAGANYTAAAFFTGYLYALIFHTSNLLNQGNAGGYYGGGWQFWIAEGLADQLRIPEAGWR